MATITIYAFEPVPEIFRVLQSAIAHNPFIKAIPLALSDHIGNQTFYLSSHPDKPEKPFQAGSLLAPQERLLHSPVTYKRTIMVPAITLDAWAYENKVNNIDFLWLDVQGAELAIMQASPNFMAKIKVLWVEVNFIQAYAGQPLYPEVKNWLESQGFTLIARDFDENPTWFFGNCLFIRSKQNPLTMLLDQVR